MYAVIRLALYEPDIPQNTAAILRLSACLGVAVDIIEPCGFVLDDRRMRRVGMDYIGRAAMRRHSSWQAYRQAWPPEQPDARLLLLTTSGDAPYFDFAFRAGDVLLLGRESAGVPSEVHDVADARLLVPMEPGMRSLNVALAAAMVLGEALRQLGAFPHPADQE